MDAHTFPHPTTEFSDELNEALITYAWSCHMIGGMGNVEVGKDAEKPIWAAHDKASKALAQMVVTLLTNGILNKSEDDFPDEYDIAHEILFQLAQPNGDGYRLI